jgi:hypothetical protein
MPNKDSYLAKTRLVEEVPGVPPHLAYYIWHDRRVVWQGATKAEGEAWADANCITIEQFEPFEF